MDVTTIGLIGLFVICDCFCLCWCCFGGKCKKMCCGNSNVPSNAKPIHSPEREEILRELAGMWKIVPISVIPPKCCLGCEIMDEPYLSRRIAAYSQACVTGNSVSYSGGPTGRWLSYKIILKRTPQGTLYLDELGSYVEVWDKQKNEITIYNDLQKSRLRWRREGVQEVVMQQPVAPLLQAPVAPAPAVVVLPAWWSTMTDPSGRLYYRNDHKGTTSWTPPSAEQIAAETRERQSQGYGGTGAGAEGAPPPAY